MPEIRMPRLNSNDTTYILVEWLVADGQHVRAGEPVAVVETSKATEELVAEADGYLRRAVAAGGEFGIGDLIGLQFDTEPEHAAGLVAESTVDGGFVLTDAARVLVAEHRVPDAALAGLGRKLIRASDVEAILTRSATPTGPGPDRQQRAVAAVVSASHREIPAAFTVMRVYLDAVPSIVESVRAEQHAVVGLPELLVRALGLLDHEFPVFYAGPHGDRRDVGVTIDTGTGLFIPVVRAAGTLSLGQISAILMGYRKKAVRRTFAADELAGAGDIVLSLSHEPDVVLAQTIIYPGHTGMLSVGGILSELQLGPTGAVEQRRYVHLGLTFDHRAANGRDAVAFLRAVKVLVETGHPRLTGTGTATGTATAVGP